MKLVRSGGDPFQMLTDLHNEISRLFSVSAGKVPMLKEEMKNPFLDLYEDKDNFYVEADLPGFNQSDINVSLKADVLTIKAQREEKKEEKKKGYICCERFKGRFYRAVSLPSVIEGKKVKALYRDGVLKITLPKKEESKQAETRINISS